MENKQILFRLDLITSQRLESKLLSENMTRQDFLSKVVELYLDNKLDISNEFINTDSSEITTEITDIKDKLAKLENLLMVHDSDIDSLKDNSKRVNELVGKIDNKESGYKPNSAGQLIKDIKDMV